MSKIHEAFENGKAFIAFVTGGDPDLDTTKKIIKEMEKAGADLIEIGIPFSDPIAEGPIIQEANERALANGCTTDKLFDALKDIKDEVSVPLVFLTYINPIYAYDVDKFLDRCNECGIQGLIIPDLPYEEKDEIADECKNHDVDIISLIAPVSHDRIKMIANDAKGFIYTVSSMGVTGMRNEIKTDLQSIVSHIKSVTDVPVAIGFGINKPQQAKEFSAYADGVIVGSAIVNIVAEHGKDAPEYVFDYVKSMKDAIR